MKFKHFYLIIFLLFLNCEDTACGGTGDEDFIQRLYKFNLVIRNNTTNNFVIESFFDENAINSLNTGSSTYEIVLLQENQTLMGGNSLVIIHETNLTKRNEDVLFGKGTAIRRRYDNTIRSIKIYSETNNLFLFKITNKVSKIAVYESQNDKLIIIINDITNTFIGTTNE